MMFLRLSWYVFLFDSSFFLIEASFYCFDVQRDMFTEEQNKLIEFTAEMLYDMIHARYMLTSKGVATMLDKYKNYDFGRCPKVCCSKQPCLPVVKYDENILP
ncbi:hypothetical protein Fmac_005861 [Flemingia macrophylla]|uniref:Casein kinase II subunit beta n=1 Tax=Flemingia macrophylla TaxID=520843 RepID=A0ABD1N906_9FABA